MSRMHEDRGHEEGRALHLSSIGAKPNMMAKTSVGILAVRSTARALCASGTRRDHGRCEERQGDMHALAIAAGH